MRRRIRIAYVIGTLDVGGAERQLAELVSHLDPERFEPVVCCLSTGGALEPRLRARGLPVEVVGLRDLRRHRGLAAASRPPRLLARLGRFAGFLRAERPDIVHGFLWWGGLVGAWMGRLAGVPVVVASRRNLGVHRGARTPAVRAGERLTNRMTDLIIANSEAVRRAALCQERLRPEKVTVIHNGVDVARFRVPADSGLRQALGIGGRAPVVGVVANLIPYKGHDVLLDAWTTVLGAFPQAVALLVGEGPARARLEALTAAKGLGESVRFLGTREDVPALLALMDLVVHPSLQEGFSNAVLEAMAAEKPVVATAVGGTPEAVVDGETGRLVPPRDAGALAAAMVQLAADPGQARKLGEAGGRRVVERFGLSTMVRGHEAAYERLMTEKAGRVRDRRAG